MITKYKLLHRLEILEYELTELEARLKVLEKGLKVKPEPKKRGLKVSVSKATKAKD